MNIITTLFIYVVILCIGAAIGALIERALKRRTNPPAPPPPPLPLAKKNPLAEADDIEVLGAWRTRNNKVWLDMDGTRLNDKADLQPGQYQRLVNLVLDLRPWLETVRPAAAGTGPIPQPVRPSIPAPTTPPPPVQVDKKNGMPSGEPIKPAPVVESIIQQVDKVLQARLATSPFKDRGIQLVEGPGSIVIVKDGATGYEGIDAVPDPDIKTLIRQAVADWEKSQK